MKRFRNNYLKGIAPLLIAIIFFMVLDIFYYHHEKFTFVIIYLALIAFLSNYLLWQYLKSKEENNRLLAQIEKNALEKHYSFLLKNANDIILLADSDKKILEANDAALNAFGYTKEEMLKLSIKDLRAPQEIDQIDNDYKSLDDRYGETFESLDIRKNGEIFPVEISSRPIEIDGKIFYQNIIRDITERKKMMKELISAKEKAEEMNQLKSNFLNNMSHELRTPLVAILGYARLLMDEIEVTEEKEMLEEIIAAGNRLLNTITSILDISKIESNKISLSFSGIDLFKEVESVANIYNSMAVKKHLSLTLEKKSENTVSMLDKRIFTNIIDNLISNAIKYTHKGEIVISVGTVLIDDVEWCKLTVSDTGIGIRADRLSIIFEAFRQASEGLSRSYEGNGLGLTITKKYVEMMDGVINVESELGRGSTFTLFFKAITTTNKGNGYSKIEKDNTTLKHDSSEMSVSTNRKLLIVDDDDASRDIICRYLKDLYKIDVAKTGDVAIKMASKNKYDAILMDINLGIGINGINTVKKISNLNGYNSVPIAAVTAFAMDGDREEFLENGFTQYISKPFEKENLLNIISEMVESEKD